MIELIKHTKNLASNNQQTDEWQLKMNLQKIKDALLTAPPDVSPELMAKFKSVADFADSKDLNSPETLKALFETVEPLFDSLSDE